MSSVKTQRQVEVPSSATSSSSPYLSERRALRVLELACPGTDSDLRENCAYLVSQHRMTIDEAIEYVRSEAEKDKNAAAAATTTTTLSRAGATTTRETGRTSVAAGEGLEDVARVPLRTYKLSPPHVGSPFCQREGLATDNHIDKRVGYDEYQSTRTQLSQPAGVKMTATRFSLVPAKSAAPSAVSVDVLCDSSTPVSCTPKTEYIQGSSVPTAAQSVAAMRRHSLVAAEDESPLSGNTAGAWTRPCGDAPSSHSRREAVRATNELRSPCAALQPIVQERTRPNGSSVSQHPASSATSISHELCSTGRTARASPLLGPKRNVYSNGETATKALLSAPERPPTVVRPPLQPSVLSLLSHPNSSDDAAKKNGVYNENEREAESESSFEAEPLLSELKQITGEERDLFQAQQARMMCYWYRDDTSQFEESLSRYGPGQVLLFRTSMTGELAVRDHCRLMETLLSVKLIPHHTIDIADSEFFQRRVRKMYTQATRRNIIPKMPLLFVDSKLIGDFVTVQELEDCGELDTKLIEAGCRVLRQRVIKAYGRRKAGFPAAPLVLPHRKNPVGNNIDCAESISTAFPPLPRDSSKRSVSSAAASSPMGDKDGDATPSGRRLWRQRVPPLPSPVL